MTDDLTKEFREHISRRPKRLTAPRDREGTSREPYLIQYGDSYRIIALCTCGNTKFAPLIQKFYPQLPEEGFVIFIPTKAECELFLAKSKESQ